MGNRRISNDLKEAAVRLMNRGTYTMEEITAITRISRRTLFRVARQKRLTGSVAKTVAVGRGRPRSLVHADAQYLLSLARHNPTLFLDEYHDRLQRYRHLQASLATIHRTLRQAKLSIKRVQQMAAERDPQKRADFVRRVGEYPAECLVSIDEASKDDRTYSRLWGRAETGQRAAAYQPFVRKRRFSLVAGLTVDGILGSKVVEGSFTQDKFIEFLRDSIVSGSNCHPPAQFQSKLFQMPLTMPYPGPRSVLIMDNARIHHSDEIQELVYGYGI
jgi:transposase